VLLCIYEYSYHFRPNPHLALLLGSTAGRLWRHPVNAVKPLLTAVVTHTSNITIRLYCRGPFPVVQCRCEYSYRFGRNLHLALLLGSQGCELGFLTDSQ